jgi:hypothetical protein
MDQLLQRELAEAGVRLRKAIARAINEAPECLPHKHGKWSVEFRNLASGEGITVTYSHAPKIAKPAQEN